MGVTCAALVVVGVVVYRSAHDETGFGQARSADRSRFVAPCHTAELLAVSGSLR